MENKEELSQKKRRATKKVPKHEKLHYRNTEIQNTVYLARVSLEEE